MNEDYLLSRIIFEFKKQNYDRALTLCGENVNKNFNYIILNLKGLIFLKKNDYKNSELNFLLSIKFKNNFLDAYKNLYILYIKNNKNDLAIKTAKKIIEIENNTNQNSIFNLAYAYEINKNFREAIKIYEELEFNNYKNKINLFTNLANCYFKIENISKAKNYYLKSFKQDKKNIISMNNLLSFYLKIQNEKMIELFYKKLKKTDNKSFIFKLNESIYFFINGFIEKSISTLKNLITKNNNYHALNIISQIYANIGDLKNAEYYTKIALKNYPSDETRFSNGIFQLINGNFNEGWKSYELRNFKFKDSSFDHIKNWENENLTYSSILVISEQGVGDVLQFSKFLLKLSPMCKKIDFILFDKLLPIYKKKFKNINFIKKSEALTKKYDYKIYIGSLNKFFYNKKITSAENLIFFNYKKKKEREKNLILRKKNIGIIWSGNIFGPNEPFRSIKLDKFENLLKLNANFFSLQNEIWDRDKIFFNKSNIIDLSRNNFDDILAIIQNLDLVITIDTSFVHLACLCKKETWLLLSTNPDWRWFKYYELNPYQNLKIFRQTDFNNWDKVIDLLENDLKKKLNC